MCTAFLLDLGLYYFGVASQPFKFGDKALLQRTAVKAESRVTGIGVQAPAGVAWDLVD